METEVTVTVAEPKPAKKAEVSAEKPSDKNTVAEIKAYLDAQNVEYASSAKKADLLALV
nr:HeH/LEM domain-containing protein [Weissella diestrammenae]